MSKSGIVSIGYYQHWILNESSGRRRLTFEGLVGWLRDEAKELLLTNPSTDGLDVVGIDLTRRHTRVATRT